MLYPSWREKFTVRSFDIGLNAKMRMSSVCSHLQEIAGKHANHLGVGYKFMQQTGKVWVLSRLFMKIHKLPEWGQDFYAETWPLGVERIFFRRDYQIDDGKEILISACSYWILLDMIQHRPSHVQIDENVLKINSGRFAMQMPSEGFPAVHGEIAGLHKVKYSDLDQNRHVNNARYVEWIFDLIDEEILEKNTPTGFAIEYKQEVKSGDSVVFKKEILSDTKMTFRIEGHLSDSNKLCVRSKIEF